MSKNSKNSNGSNSNSNAKQTQAAPKQEPKPKKEKKAKEPKVPNAVEVVSVARVPGMNGNPDIEIPVTLYSLSPEAVAGLEAAGRELTLAEKEHMFPTRKHLSQWIKEAKPKRAKKEKGERTRLGVAKSLYRKALGLRAISFHAEGGAREDIIGAAEMLELAAEKMGLDQDAYLTELNSKPKKEKKEKKAKKENKAA